MSLHTASSSPNRHLCHPPQDPQGGQGSPLLIRPAHTPTQKILRIHTFVMFSCNKDWSSEELPRFTNCSDPHHWTRQIVLDFSSQRSRLNSRYQYENIKMATVTFTAQIDMTDLNMNRLSVNLIQAGLLDNVYANYEGTTYQDVYVVDWYLGGYRGSFVCGCQRKTSTHVKAYAHAVKLMQLKRVKLRT